jgi:hypothetical protein
LNIDLPKLRGLVIDTQIGALSEPEKIAAEIQIWEAVRSWADLNRKFIDIVQELGDKIELDSFFATDVIGIRVLDKWREDPAGLQTEKETLIADLAEMDRLIAKLRKGKR